MPDQVDLRFERTAAGASAKCFFHNGGPCDIYLGRV
jgi:hypothetical protein